MGDAFQCDRCDGFGDGEPSKTITTTEEEVKRISETYLRSSDEIVRRIPLMMGADEVVVRREEEEEYDLCPECEERHQNFLDDKLGFPDP